MALGSQSSCSAVIARRRVRIVLLFVMLIMLIGVVSSGTADAQEDCGGLFQPRCPEVTTSTTAPPVTTTPPTTEPPSTTATTGIATTVVVETTTTTTTTVATTAAHPSQPETTSVTVPPTTTTTAPPEAAPQAPTTTIGVGDLRRITQSTPDMTGVLVLWALGLLGTSAVLAVGFYRNRLRRN